MSEDNKSTKGCRFFTRKGILFIAGIFLLGFAAFGGMNTVLSYTNEMDFCTSCHSMKINLEEYKETLHYKNSSGVRATCSDCHVPKEFFPKMKAKILAYKDVLHEILGTIDTPEKYEAHRWDMASRVWEKMRASDSRECRSCHEFEYMNFEEQERRAQRKHTQAIEDGESCISCHKGVAHTLPEEPAAQLAE